MCDAESNADVNAAMAILRILGANARMFMLSATVSPTIFAMYSIWVGAIV